MKLTKLIMMSAFVLMMVSCNKEQTGLSVEDIPGRATIMGKLIIDKGQTYQNDRFENLVQPAANVTLTVKLYNTDLSQSENASGYTYYKVTTDAAGNWSISVPTVEDGVKFKIAAPSVLGTYSKLSSYVVENGKYLFNEQNVVYSWEYSSNDGLKPGEIKVVNGTYSHSENGGDIPEVEYYSMEINVGMCLPARTTAKKEDYKSSQNRYIYNSDIVPAESIDVVLTRTYNAGDVDGDGENDTATLYYGGTTDANGHLTVTMPCSNPYELTRSMYSLSVHEFLGKKDFVYYGVQYIQNQNEYVEASCTIPAESYTISLEDDNVKNYAGAYDFQFFKPSIKAIIAIDSIDNGADKGIMTTIDADDTNNATATKYFSSFYRSKYTSLWTIDNFTVE